MKQQLLDTELREIIDRELGEGAPQLTLLSPDMNGARRHPSFRRDKYLRLSERMVVRLPQNVHPEGWVFVDPSNEREMYQTPYHLRPDGTLVQVNGHGDEGIDLSNALIYRRGPIQSELDSPEARGGWGIGGLTER